MCIRDSDVLGKREAGDRLSKAPDRGRQVTARGVGARHPSERGDVARRALECAAVREARRGALQRSPGYVPALAGMARTDAARGDLPTAIGRLRQAVTRLPLPEYV